ncbi:MAG: hypothetical protein EOM28_04590 [Clostridia bacterium]|nr:hypothetical protein [Clostridia bacterium]
MKNPIYLTALPSPLNLNVIIFGSIVVSALGTVMDVAMDIVSSLHEICQHSPKISLAGLVKSNFTIERDIMGTMPNTLVSAYTGSSLFEAHFLLYYCSLPMLIPYPPC